MLTIRTVIDGRATSHQVYYVSLTPNSDIFGIPEGVSDFCLFPPAINLGRPVHIPSGAGPSL
jgi:hypothetical protein